VQATRFLERAQAIAAEVGARRPEVIGLQEVEVIRTDTPADGSATPAETVLYDYLDILLAALTARGLHYAPAAVVQNSDTELPTALGFDVRATDRDVILVRTDLRRADLKWRNPQAANFATNLIIPTLGGPITLLRGWTALDLKIRGKKFRVVNTHLEPFHPGVQVAQAMELLGGAGATSRPTLFMGDFNSRADMTGSPTYGILRAAGFDDAWSDEHPGDPGLTCCWEAHLLSPVPPFDERIDLVLHRGGFMTISSEIVGENAAVDRTPSGSSTPTTPASSRRFSCRTEPIG
jgi:endonuclease/exonuclease/phosphatase family metal-dependent hydrolase